MKKGLIMFLVTIPTFVRIICMYGMADSVST